MANIITSPNMNLPIPVQGVDSGPDYALNVNASLLTIDGHNHAVGSGVQIQPSGLNISSDLSIQGNNLIDVRSTRYQSQVAPLALVTDLGIISNIAGDLYWNNNSGTPVQITSGSSVVGAAGTISGLPSGTASVSYAAGTFVFQSATSTAAVIDGGSVILRNNTASSKGLTLNPPNAMAADYNITLPALPGSTYPLVIDPSGNIVASQISASQIASGSITTTQISGSAGITGSQLANLTVGTAQIADASVTTAKIGASNYVVSSSCGSFTTASLTFVDVTNLSVTIGANSRPVVIMLIPDGTVSNAGSLYANNNVGGSIRLLEGAFVYANWDFGASVTTANQRIPVGCISFMLVPTATSHTYKIQIASSSSPGSVGIIHAQLVAYEIK